MKSILLAFLLFTNTAYGSMPNEEERNINIRQAPIFPIESNFSQIPIYHYDINTQRRLPLSKIIGEGHRIVQRPPKPRPTH